MTISQKSTSTIMTIRKAQILSMHENISHSATYYVITVVLSQYKSMYAVVANDSREATLHVSLVLEIKAYLCLLNKQITVTDRPCIIILPV